MQFKRALAGQNVDAAWMLALELPPLPLVDALALLLLSRDADPDPWRGAGPRPAVLQGEPVA